MSKKISYAIFYAVFYGFHAINRNFFPLYFQGLGFSSLQIAICTASEDISNIIGPILTVHLVHILKNKKFVFILGTLFAILSYLPLFSVTGFGLVLSSFLACIIFTKTPLVLVDTKAIEDASQNIVHFGRLRIAGSIGFIVVTFLLGYLFDLQGTGVIVYFGLGMLILLATIVFSLARYFSISAEFTTPLSPFPLAPSKAPLLDLPKYPEWKSIWQLHLVSALLWASMSVFYTYFSLYLKELGWGGKTIAISWGISVFVEILMLHYHHLLEHKFSLFRLLQISLLGVILRWMMLLSTTALPLILLSQALHAFVIAGFHVTSMKLAYNIFPAEYRDRAQGILTSVGMGCGLLLGRLLAGMSTLLLPPGASLQNLFFGSLFLSCGAYLVSRPMSRETRELV